MCDSESINLDSKFYLQLLSKTCLNYNNEVVLECHYMTAQCYVLRT